MRTRHHPLKWPLSICLAMVLFLGAVFWVPNQWIDFFFSPLNIAENQMPERTGQWMNILPPPTIEIIQLDEKLPEVTTLSPITPLADDPDWWTQGWRIQTVSETRVLMKPTPVDSVAVILQALGMGLDFTRKALPDSVLNHQLMILGIEDGFAFEELKPYLSALARARAMMDKKSRESDIYDEHLGSQIMVPD